MIKTKTAKTSKAAPKAASKPAAKAERIERDKLGCRVGTAAARINAAITTKPQDAGAIAEKSGLPPARVRHHLNWHVKKGNLRATKDGFALKA